MIFVSILLILRIVSQVTPTLEQIKWMRLKWIRFENDHDLAKAFAENFHYLVSYFDYVANRQIEHWPDWIDDLAQEFMQRKFR